MFEAKSPASLSVFLTRRTRRPTRPPSASRLTDTVLSGAMHDNSLTRHRWVRIETDYGADGVWNRDGAACSADWLPVSPELIARIRAWQAVCDDFLGVLEEIQRGGLVNEQRDHWIEGFEIAKEVKAALPDWTVIVGDAPFEFEVVPRTYQDRVKAS